MRKRWSACVVALACIVLFAGAQPAAADLRLAVFGGGFSFATVGQPGLDFVAITNLSIESDSHGPLPGDPLTLTSIVLVPSCGVQFTTECPAGFRDPGIFALRSPAVGRADTQCAGVTFAVMGMDASEGRLQLVPSAPVVLQPGQQCTFDYTFDVSRAPAIDSRPDDIPGLQTDGMLSVSAVSPNGTSTEWRSGGSGTVSRAVTRLTAAASGAVSLGGRIGATAVLTQGFRPTGAITFRVFGPDDPTCARAPAFVSAPVAVTPGNATYPSTPYTPRAAGAYRFTATYSGDANNDLNATHCSNPNADVLVGGRPPSRGGRVINGTAGGDSLVGTAGDDVIACGDGDDVVRAGGGDDVIRCGFGDDHVDGGPGNDRIVGDAGGDSLRGGPGEDRVAGSGGHDRLAGGSGADRLSGSSGRDRLAGGAGPDRLSGGPGSDLLAGGSGRDRLRGGLGRDRLVGGPGRDDSKQ